MTPEPGEREWGVRAAGSSRRPLFCARKRHLHGSGRQRSLRRRDCALPSPSRYVVIVTVTIALAPLAVVKVMVPL